MKRSVATATGRLDLVGRDLGRTERTPRPARRRVTLLFTVAMAAALAVAALRIDLIRIRYGLAKAVHTEKALLQERREIVARVRALRDPVRLSELARRQGFVRPSHIQAIPPIETRP
ncbi:MAG: hypothetical protein VX546_11300 [Myxococcota bacterium]|nr:hypothetical protein [Myxococcota bacterium]